MASTLSGGAPSFRQWSAKRFNACVVEAASAPRAPNTWWQSSWSHVRAAEEDDPEEEELYGASRLSFINLIDDLFAHHPVLTMMITVLDQPDDAPDPQGSMRCRALFSREPSAADTAWVLLRACCGGPGACSSGVCGLFGCLFPPLSLFSLGPLLPPAACPPLHERRAPGRPTGITLAARQGRLGATLLPLATWLGILISIEPWATAAKNSLRWDTDPWGNNAGRGGAAYCRCRVRLTGTKRGAGVVKAVKCKACGRAPYCGKACHEADWPTHQPSCLAIRHGFEGAKARGLVSDAHGPVLY